MTNCLNSLFTHTTAWKTDSESSDAVSSASITPPSLNRFVQIDRDGRRRLLPPPGFGPTPEHKPEPLCFTRKEEYTDLVIPMGGIALAREHEEGSTPLRVRRGPRYVQCELWISLFKSCGIDFSNLFSPFDQNGQKHESLGHGFVPSAFAIELGSFGEKIFVTEEELIYDTRIPASTF